MNMPLFAILALLAAGPLPARAREPAGAADSLATALPDSLPAATVDAEAAFKREYEAWLARSGASDVVASWVRIETVLEVADGRVKSFEGRFTKPFKMSGIGSVYRHSSSIPLIQVPGEIQAGDEVIIFHVFKRVGRGGRDPMTIEFAMRIAK
jgi:hypothetical protein